MPQFKSGWSFVRFTEAVRFRYRYARTKEVDEFLAALLGTCDSRVILIPSGFEFWRAQQGTDQEERALRYPDITVYYPHDVPLGVDRMKPLPHAAHEGRVNSKGIPCLYLAIDKETAMSEVRPWLGAKLSVANFRTVRPLRIIDCSVGHSRMPNPDLFLRELSAEETTQGIWTQVDRAFSEPVHDDLATAAYAPTQVIAEAFRQAGFDGIQYQSRLGPGRNVVLFDLNAASLVEGRLFKVKRVAYEFIEYVP